MGLTLKPECGRPWSGSMSDYASRPLPAVIELQRGFDLPTQDRRPGTVPVVASTSVVGHHDQAMVVGPGVVIGRSGSLGGGQWVDSDFWPLNTTLWVRDFRGNHARWVYYLLRSLDFSRFNAGSGVPTLNRNHLSEVLVPVPPLRDQVAIAQVLGAIDDKIAANRTQVRLIRDLLQASFTQLLTPAYELAHPEAEGWQMVSLGEWLDVIETGSRPRGGVARYVSGVPSIGAESIVGLAAFDYSKTKFVPTEFFNAMKRGVVQNRDVLLYKDGGRPGEFEPHVSLLGDGYPFPTFCINEHVYRLRARPPLSQEYLYCWLSSAPLLDEMRRRGTGVAIPGLNSTAVKALPLTIPPEPLLRAFTGSAEALTGLALARAQEAAVLAPLRDTLLPRLLSGELRLHHIQALAVEAV